MSHLFELLATARKALTETTRPYSNVLTRLRPALFALYNAASARFTSSSTL